MIDSQIKGVILSPDDVVTQRQWRRAICAFYAGIILILAAVCGVHQFVKPVGEIQFAGSPGLALTAEAARGDPAASRQ
jgi:hypothetical protein